jgi:hypothetical protein
MAMMLFTLLNGLGVVFLVYVLVQFWKEGHRSEQPDASGSVIEFSVERKPTVVVVTHPISNNAHSGLSVVSSRARLSSLQDGPIHGSAAAEADEMPVRRYSSW